jgi:hypothetical protein
MVSHWIRNLGLLYIAVLPFSAVFYFRVQYGCSNSNYHTRIPNNRKKGASSLPNYEIYFL